MDQNEIRIEELKSRIDENNTELKQIYLAAAEKVLSDDLAGGSEEGLSALLAKVATSDEKLREIDSRMDDLRTTYNRISEIADREKEIGEEYSHIEKENRKLFVPLGRAAYGKLRDRPDSEYRKLMDSLSEGEEQFRDLEAELFRLENKSESGGFFAGIRDKSRTLLLRSRKKNSLSSLDGIYGRLGEKIYRKDLSFFDNLESDSVSMFLKNRKKMEKLDGEITVLKEENSALEKHLKSRFNSNRRKKSEEKLQSERDLAQSDKMAGLSELGKFLYEKRLDFGDGSLAKLYESADSVRKTVEELKDEIEKCKAEIEIARLEDEVSEMKKSIKDLEITIEKCNSDISEFNKEIKQARAEIKRLKKLTGAGGESADPEN